MSTSLTLVAQLTSSGLNAVLIGGHAVAARGHVRATFDLDIVVPESQRSRWREALVALGYTLFHEQGAFVQLNAPVKGAWPIDVMVVDDKTFDQISHDADLMSLGGAELRVASRLHLIAMKLHVLKTRQADRWSKDLLDLFELSTLEGLDVEGPAFAALCNKFGDAGLLQELLKARRPK